MQNPVYHFHILRSARDLYQVEEDLFHISGNVVFANFYQARALAQAMNKMRDTLRFPETAVKAGHINAMGLIDEVLHFVMGLYKEQEAADVMGTALGYLENKFNNTNIDEVLLKFVRLYPPPAVYQSGTDEKEYLTGTTAGVSNREIVFEEMVMLRLANTNPAFEPFIELFDDTELAETTVYTEMMEQLKPFFDSRPKFGPKNQNLLTMLESPARVSPRSLSGQIDYIQREWGPLLGNYLLRLLQAVDFIKEEERPYFAGPGPSRVYTYNEEEELERFTRDKEWMPRVILLAKSTYVWLHQLSEKYGTPIERLDQVPEEELDLLASRGFTALWLIGLWERSPASKRIKQICGNPEAEASAYSLMEYEIARDLGGWEALNNLKRRCSLKGIRLSSDMVPNHTGIDSKWVINHPDWFVQLPHQPYPQYSYNGEDLCHDDRVSVQIEDHYYDKTDAAVTFKRLDTHTGEARYIYHGNDGTSMPWNDTAQLNFLNADVREAVIQTILHVARNFHIIRFDAAMTLTKRHFQRLWFPEPGSGGDIPTRAEHGLSREEFHRAIPEEFWREVVDRIMEEVPETLLIAEAFWLMEGYFVRTLGMHRVYNSAFMNMMMKEENEKYRSTIKNTQEFDPDILKRFVNFMSNPDEETAIGQFGDGDKYFGVCTMMATMPGLPMFGHGQIEGYREKYGMEYRRSYWNERENTDLIRRHEREIFPLLKRRHIFAEVENFHLYDVYNPQGGVNENVFAFSNRNGRETALVMFNNGFQRAEGWIHNSAAFAEKQEDGSKRLLQRSLGYGLNLPADPKTFALFRDHKSGLWFIRNCKEIWDRGLYIGLDGYEAQVFLDFYTVGDNEFGHYNQLATQLDGRGTPDVKRAMQEIFLAPVHSILEQVLNRETVALLVQGEAPPDSLFAGYVSFLEEAGLYIPKIIDTANLSRQKEALQRRLETAAVFCRVLMETDDSAAAGAPFAPPEHERHILTLLPFYFSLADAKRNAGIAEQLLLQAPVSKALQGILPDETMKQVLELLDILTALQETLETAPTDDLYALMIQLLEHSEAGSFIGEHRYEDVLYFHKESFELLMRFIILVRTANDYMNNPAKMEADAALSAGKEKLRKLLNTAEQAGYRTETFTELLQTQAKPGRKKSRKSPPTDRA